MRAIIVQRRMPWERNYLDELKSLAESAGYTVVGELSQVRHPDPKYQIGPGKAEELAEMVKKLKADIVIFDPNKIIDTATFTDPHRFPIGIEYVIVNGEIVIEKDRHTGKLPGKVLKNRRALGRIK